MSILYESKEEFHIPHSTFNIEFFAPQKTLGGYCGGVPPLPIPNREVKPACADGTAMQCGRVGGCLLYFGSSRSNDFGDLLYARTFHIFFYFPPYFLTLLAQNITFARAIYYYIAAFFGLFTYLFNSSA